MNRDLTIGLLLLSPLLAHAIGPTTPSPAIAPSMKSAVIKSPIYVGLSVHVEGGSECRRLLETGGVAPTAGDCDSDKYNRHVRNLQEFASLFVNSTTALPLSLEFEEEFLNAAKAFREERTGRLSALAREGHLLAAHGDSYAYSGEARGALDYTAVKNHFSHLKSTLESPDVQTAQSSISLISGVCTSVDWMKAIQTLGYTVTTGIVSYCLRSLPEGAFPSTDIPGGSTSITAACPNPSTCHATYPYAYYSSTDGKYVLRDAMVPWRTDAALKFRGGQSAIQKSNWQASVSTGGVAIISGVGQLYCLAEKKLATSRTESETHCSFCRDDIDAYFEMLDQALGEGGVLTTRTFTSVYSLGTAASSRVGSGCRDGTPSGTKRSELLSDFATRISRYVTDGKVIWKAIPEMNALVR